MKCRIYFNLHKHVYSCCYEAQEGIPPTKVGRLIPSYPYLVGFALTEPYERVHKGTIDKVRRTKRKAVGAWLCGNLRKWELVVGKDYAKGVIEGFKREIEDPIAGVTVAEIGFNPYRAYHFYTKPDYKPIDWDSCIGVQGVLEPSEDGKHKPRIFATFK